MIELRGKAVADAHKAVLSERFGRTSGKRYCAGLRYFIGRR